MGHPLPVDRETVAVLFAGLRPEHWLEPVGRLQQAHPGITILVGSPDGTLVSSLAAAGATPRVASSLSALANQAWLERSGHVLVLTRPVLVPAAGLAPALALVTEDLSVATVSFLGDYAGFGTFPAGWSATTAGDPDVVTARLRAAGPGRSAAPIPFATGPAVLLAAAALSAVGPLDATAGRAAEAAVADFSARARARGFVDLLDGSTYCSTALGVAVPTEGHRLWPEDRLWLFGRHPYLAAPEQGDARAQPHAVVHTAARARVRGLRVVVDASWHGTWEMGTQVQAVALISALARRTDIERVSVAIPAEPPPRLRAQLDVAKVDLRVATPGALDELGPADIFHRPFQPDGPFDLACGRRVASRTIVTVLDLIAYHVGAYFPSGQSWMTHRHELRRTLAVVDGVVVISQDVARRARVEQLPIAPHRLFVVPLGTDHLSGEEPVSAPTRVSVTDPFMLVLGASYAHKNRDLAVSATGLLRRRGSSVSLVLAGLVIPGQEDPAAILPENAVSVLSHVSAAERNWLLRHASVVLYPTSAEGFGLVPHEAARFGTPTVLVPFGPLSELAGDLPVTARDWSPTALADAAEQLLSDPSLAEAQVRAMLAAGATLTWDACAGRLVDAYRAVLAQPPAGA